MELSQGRFAAQSLVQRCSRRFDGVFHSRSSRANSILIRRKKEEGRGKKEEGRGKKEEGRRKKEEGRRKKEEGRRKKEEK
ncbi:hypothetical protein [Microcoleus sp. D2_18a_B4]|uniref:hypothetical protein n=1 Tax=Microcoleus sp. D2_18a_B4 TaxID=3055329 RepID=UPI002FD60495